MLLMREWCISLGIVLVVMPVVEFVVFSVGMVVSILELMFETIPLLSDSFIKEGEFSRKEVFKLVFTLRDKNIELGSLAFNRHLTHVSEFLSSVKQILLLDADQLLSLL